jgi:hypothetical protein
MIFSLARRRANGAPNTDFNAMVSEGNLAFMMASKNFNASNDIKFSTYLFRCADNAMKGLLREERKQQFADYEIEPSAPSQPEREVAFKQWISMLSKESQFIISVVWDTPSDIIQWAREESYCPKVTIKLITKHLRKLGWKWDLIRACYKEIRWALKSF